jgi:hypothetical protein
MDIRKKLTAKNVLLAASTVAMVFTIVAPWDVFAEESNNSYHLLQDINGGTPWVLLLVGLVLATTIVQEDINDGAPRAAAGGSGSGHHRG